MDSYLRQSTASQSRTLGPFLDDTDGKTPETALTIAAADVKLSANGGAAANKNSGGGTHRVNGEYSLTFDAADTANVGELLVSVVVAGALPVRAKFVVLSAAVYDALFADAAPGFSTYDGSNTAGVTELLTRLTAARAGYLDKLNVSGDLAHTDNAGTFKADVSGLSTYDGSDTAGVTQLLTRLTVARAGYLDKLNVSGVLAHTDNAGNFKADVSGVGGFDPTTEEVENGVTYEKAFRGLFSVTLGVISTAGESTEIFGAVGNPGTARVSANVNAAGDRTSVTVN